MPAQILDGSAVAAQLYADTAVRAERVRRHVGRKPCLATVLIGADPSSHTYVGMKVRRCAQYGLESRRIDLPASTTTAEAVSLVRRLSADPRVDGILVQHPVPAHVDERAVFEAIAPDKDVDGVTAASFAAQGLGFQGIGLTGFESCTPGGIMRLLDAYSIDVRGLDVTVVGASVILGRPLGLLMLAREATVSYCHKATADLAAHVRRADVVVAAAGVPHLIRGEWIKPGAVVVDAGYHSATRCGDVDYASAAARASWITPVPGGVGPMTIATLLAQTVASAEQSAALAA